MTSFYDVISDDFQKIHFIRSDFSKNWDDCSFDYTSSQKKFRTIPTFLRRYDVIIFADDVVCDDFDDVITASKMSESL